MSLGLAAAAAAPRQPGVTLTLRASVGLSPAAAWPPGPALPLSQSQRPGKYRWSRCHGTVGYSVVLSLARAPAAGRWQSLVTGLSTASLTEAQ